MCATNQYETFLKLPVYTSKHYLLHIQSHEPTKKKKKKKKKEEAPMMSVVSGQFYCRFILFYVMFQSITLTLKSEKKSLTVKFNRQIGQITPKHTNSFRIQKYIYVIIVTTNSPNNG